MVESPFAKGLHRVATTVHRVLAPQLDNQILPQIELQKRALEVSQEIGYAVSPFAWLALESHLEHANQASKRNNSPALENRHVNAAFEMLHAIGIETLGIAYDEEHGYVLKGINDEIVEVEDDPNLTKPVLVKLVPPNPFT